MSATINSENSINGAKYNHYSVTEYEYFAEIRIDAPFNDSSLPRVSSLQDNIYFIFLSYQFHGASLFKACWNETHGSGVLLNSKQCSHINSVKLFVVCVVDIINYTFFTTSY